MAIQDLNEHGHLPAGVHDCTIDELEARFGQYQSSDHRCRLHERLDVYLQELRGTDMVEYVIVDGSFVTSKSDPEDIDLIVVMKQGHDFAAELRPFEYNALSRRDVRRRFGFDVLLAEEGEPEYQEYVDFFSRVREEPDQIKGMLKVVL